jgi:hypothetical protein
MEEKACFIKLSAYSSPLQGSKTEMSIVDQLNIHQSEFLVRLVAERCGIQNDLGVKQKEGIFLFVENPKNFLI